MMRGFGCGGVRNTKSNKRELERKRVSKRGKNEETTRKTSFVLGIFLFIEKCVVLFNKRKTVRLKEAFISHT